MQPFMNTFNAIKKIVFYTEIYIISQMLSPTLLHIYNLYMDPFPRWTLSHGFHHYQTDYCIMKSIAKLQFISFSFFNAEQQQNTNKRKLMQAHLSKVDELPPLSLPLSLRVRVCVCVPFISNQCHGQHI